MGQPAPLYLKVNSVSLGTAKVEEMRRLSSDTRSASKRIHTTSWRASTVTSTAVGMSPAGRDGVDEGGGSAAACGGGAFFFFLLDLGLDCDDTDASLPGEPRSEVSAPGAGAVGVLVGVFSAMMMDERCGVVHGAYTDLKKSVGASNVNERKIVHSECGGLGW